MNDQRPARDRPEAVEPPLPFAPGGPEQARGVRLMVAGAILAVLAPLAGFLAGSILGPTKHVGDLDAMFVALFAGLVVGGVGALVAFSGALAWNRGSRREGSEAP